MRRRMRAVAQGLAVSLVLGGGMPATLHADPAPAAAPAERPLYSPDADPLFAQPYVDKEEWRDAPVRHLYVHGGFKGTDTRFSLYLPPRDKYQGRFFQHITPFPISENLAQEQGPGEDNKIAAAIEGGAYFVETNGGGAMDLGKVASGRGDSTISAYRANAAAAAYSRVVAKRVYATDKRPFGYAYGGSGGGFRTIGAIENTRGVWDGVVPYVIGSTMAIPNMFTVRMQAMRILGDKLAQVSDAADAGGSGDIYAGLTPLEAEALREVTRMGFPPQSWFGYKNMGIHGFAALYPGVVAADPTYFTDFWTKPGYLGRDHPERFEGARMQFESQVGQVLTAGEAARQRINLDASAGDARGGVDNAFKIPEGAEGARVAAFRLAGTPPKLPFLGGDLVVLSGAAKGLRLPLARIVGDIAVLGVADQDMARKLAAGDQVRIDNSNFLAMESYHRHQVPGRDFKVWDQFRKPDGTPLYPQRPFLIGPAFVQATAGSLQTGRVQGKVIVVASLWDREAMPWQADWYRHRVAEYLGPRTDANFRLWYTDHALHGDAKEQVSEDPTRIVNYVPVLNQALRDLADWVEKGKVPARSTQYTIDDGQVKVPASAAERHGLQPVVALTVNGGKKVEARVGQPVTFRGTIAVPPGAGAVVSAAWDFDSKGAFPEAAPVGKGARTATVSATHSFAAPGTYFVALKGAAQRQGSDATPYTVIANIDRVRVVVK